jgi:predicted TPR repeat methyltransferase
MDESRDERPITVPDAMALVLEALQNGQFEEAAEVCGKILEVAPHHPGAVHYAGVIAHENGRTDDALSLIERSLELDPDQPDWYSNLGIVRQARGDLEGAIEAYRRAIALKADHANAHGNLGVLLKVQGDLVEAEAEYRKTIELNPKHADAYHNLAVLLSATNRATEAVTCYCRALTLKPHYPEARRAMALAYCMLGQRDRAVQVCEEWIKDEPNSVVAKHTLAACSQQNVPPRASNEYVQRVFDSFASSFEAKLARLQYRAPTLVADALAETGIPADKSRDVLDVGCGTGLCGPLLAPYARNLVGVDLSGGMLNHAAEKRIYDDLIQAELTAYLQQLPRDSCDVIVTADTLVYFGGLEDVIDAAARALRPGGVLIFTVEEATEPDRGDSYSIQPHGRFSHGAAYVERLLVGAGLQPTIGRAELRLESGVPVAGLVVRGARLAGVGAPAVESAAHAAAAGERHG